jgi:hypothetical protein
VRNFLLLYKLNEYQIGVCQIVALGNKNFSIIINLIVFAYIK